VPHLVATRAIPRIATNPLPVTAVINARLVDRVERSLRKRLKTDVRPHLVRYAARATNEEEFVQSAGRLLADAQKRQLWIASWMPRIHTETNDTTPVPLDMSAFLAAATGAGVLVGDDGLPVTQPAALPAA
jgi:hypothetical protein